MTLAVQRQSDLRFYENKIKEGARSIASGFNEIFSKELWRSHPNEYSSFKDYCDGEWGVRFSYGYIQNLISNDRHCHTLNAIVTSSEISEDVTIGQGVVPVQTSGHVDALRGAGTVEEQVEIWETVVQEADGKNPTIRAIKQKIAEALEIKESQLPPLGSAIAIRTDDENVIFNGYRGWVTDYDGTTAEVTLKLPDGKTMDNVTVLASWLETIDVPPIPLPGRPKSKKDKAPKSQEVSQPPTELRPGALSDKDRIDVAIAIFQELLRRAILPDDIRSDIEKWLSSDASCQSL